MKFIDCHAHVFAENAIPYETQSQTWKQENVKRIINVFCLETDLEVAEKVLSNHHSYNDISFVAGVTPHGADKFDKSYEDFLFKHKDALVAIGETGLDFHYTMSPREDQYKSFTRHLEIAEELKKPVVLHLREADKEAQEILAKFVERIPGIMLHCYTSGKKLAQWAAEQGMYISASGIVTFKKSNDLREIFKKVPLQQLLIETDSPYLAPPPYRGKSNQPGYVVKIYEYLAEMYDVPVEKLAQQVWDNSQKLFAFS